MTIVEWLNRGRNMDKEIKALQRAQQQAYDRATSAVSDSAAEKVQTSPRNNTENSFITYASYSEKIDKRIEELTAIQQEIFEAIKALDDTTLRTILTEKYINFRTFEQIAADLEYSSVHISRLHKKAIEKLNMLWNVM